jgi:hypothetical protein
LQAVRSELARWVRTAAGGAGLAADTEPPNGRLLVVGATQVGAFDLTWSLDPIGVSYSAPAWNADNLIALGGLYDRRYFVRWAGPSGAPQSLAMRVRTASSIGPWRAGPAVAVPRDLDFEIVANALIPDPEPHDVVPTPPPELVHRWHAVLLVQAAPAAPDGSYAFTVTQEQSVQ